MSSSSNSLPCLKLNSTSNLLNFLGTTTPFVRSKPVLMRDRNQGARNARPVIEYFKMEDLWKCYDKPSACGVGTPVIMENGEVVTQFYTPFISALQLYTVRQKSSSAGVELDSTGTSSGYTTTDQTEKISRSSSANFSKVSDGNSSDSIADNESPLTAVDQIGDLYMQWFDDGSPYRRVPLSNKVRALAKDHPGILSLKSTELSPASWMAIAWYPIYPVPHKPTTKDLFACFLTFHVLSPSTKGPPLTESQMETVTDDEDGEVKTNYDYDVLESMAQIRERWRTGKVKGSRISLPPFGMARHKVVGELWTNEGSSDWKKLKELHSAADTWLKKYNVEHHDFKFFTANSPLKYAGSS